jgi:serine/threonine-protein kinase
VAAIVVSVATWLLMSPPSTERLVSRSVIAVEPWDQRPPAKPGESRPPAIQPGRKSVAISPDGRTLVFEGSTTGVAKDWQLFLRPLDRLEAVPIPGTANANANNPFFSRDGSWIGFWSNGEIRKVPTAGGPPTTIARVPGEQRPAIINSAHWGDDDVIVFGSFGALWRVSASGGTPEVVSRPGEGERAHIHPYVLPGGQAVLFTIQKTVFRWDDAQIVARSLVTGEQKVLIEDGADAQYVASGHLIFIRRGTLMAAPFDLERLTLTGGPVALVDDVLQYANLGNAQLDHGAGQFAVAAQGRLVYLTGGIAPDSERALIWVDRDGTIEPLPAPGRKYLRPRLSPDGQRIVVSTMSGSAGVVGERVWVYDISRRTLSPVTGEQERGGAGVWSPDGARIGFQTILGGRGTLSWRSADGAGTAEQLPTTERSYRTPGSWSRDGKIAFVENSLTAPTGQNDIWILDMNTADRRAVPVVQTPAGEQDPAFSPDGKWLAYSSNESGRNEVYVQPYPGPGARVVVSPDGGVAPAWRGDGAELYYHTVPGVKGTTMLAVSITVTGPKLIAGTPRTLFAVRQIALSVGTTGYDVTPDGQRFLMVQFLGDPPQRPQRPPSQMVLVENWLDEVARRVPSR